MEMIGCRMNAFGNLLLGLKYLHFVSWVWPMYILVWFSVLSDSGSSRVFFFDF